MRSSTHSKQYLSNGHEGFCCCIIPDNWDYHVFTIPRRIGDRGRLNLTLVSIADRILWFEPVLLPIRPMFVRGGHRAVVLRRVVVWRSRESGSETGHSNTHSDVNITSDTTATINVLHNKDVCVCDMTFLYNAPRQWWWCWSCCPNRSLTICRL